jgi:hypothetical protein
MPYLAGRPSGGARGHVTIVAVSDLRPWCRSVRWVQIAAELQGRGADECRRRWYSKPLLKVRQMFEVSNPSFRACASVLKDNLRKQDPPATPADAAPSTSQQQKEVRHR